MADPTAETECEEYRLPAAYSQGFAHVRVLRAPIAANTDDAPSTPVADGEAKYGPEGDEPAAA